jgi:hypothetical protein
MIAEHANRLWIAAKISLIVIFAPTSLTHSKSGRFKYLIASGVASLIEFHLVLIQLLKGLVLIQILKNIIFRNLLSAMNTIPP